MKFFCCITSIKITIEVFLNEDSEDDSNVERSDHEDYELLEVRKISFKFYVF